jgi:hypothetical protein
MKKCFLFTLLFFSVYAALCQNKWFISLSTGPGFGGPKGSIYKNMEKSNLNQKSPGLDFFGLVFQGSQYPKKSSGIPTLVKVGKRLKEGKSIYLEAGVSNRGEIAGYQNIGDYGNTIPIDFKVFQFTAGYQYSFTNTRSKVGFGPSLFVFNYIDDYKHLDHQTYNSFIPGVSLMGRVPLGKEKRLIGVDLIMEVNLAPPARMKEIQKTNYSFSSIGNSVAYTSTLKESHVNMVHGMVGWALSIRSKEKKQ